ncbi:MAG: DUF2760 domain-containing protein [Candidatus Binatia bacterium]|nr:DUF2760 domain-containing protein [Candidatus Binatia bacterium]
MSTAPKDRKVLSALLLFAGLVFSLANVAVLLITVKGSITVPLAVELYRICPPCVVYFAVAPLIVALLTVLLLRQIVPATPAAAKNTEAAPESPGKAVAQSEQALRDTGALQLLALLQREGRFLDFLAEDLGAYSDAQIGAAARAIHAGCRKALEGRLELERILSGEEGAEVTVDAAFDAEAIRLLGDVRGAPPFRGVLQHAGWRVRRCELPRIVPGSRPEILAPAEVEIPPARAESRA